MVAPAKPNGWLTNHRRMIDIEKLLNPIAPGRPCGDDPSETPRGIKFFSDIDSKLPGAKTEKDWTLIKQDCENFLRQQAKHLRPAVILSVAELELSGFDGFAGGLLLIRTMLERFWDDLYPSVKYGGEQRADCFLTFCQPGAHSDLLRAILRLSRQPIFSGEAIVSSASILAAEAAWAEKVKKATNQGKEEEVSEQEKEKFFLGIRTSAAQTTLGDRQLIEDSLQRIIQEVTGIQSLLSEKIPNDLPSWKPLLAKCGEIRAQLAKFPPVVATLPSAEPTPATSTARSLVRSNPPALVAEAASEKEEALRGLERASLYFERYEPSSPVPVLLRRAQKLIDRNFLDIIGLLTKASNPLTELFWDEKQKPD